MKVFLLFRGMLTPKNFLLSHFDIKSNVKVQVDKLVVNRKESN